jgi:5,6-dimethylbenzimidazole synthase
LTFSDEFRAELLELFRWRRDVRRFREDPVDASLVDQLVAWSAAAPSVGYSQPVRFVRVSDPERRAAIVREYEACNAAALATYEDERARLYAGLKLAGLREAPVHLAAFADEATTRGTGLGRQTMPATLEYSAVLAVHTLWLAARTYGLGVGWVSILRPERVAVLLEIPASWALIAYLCLGYPVEEHVDRELVRAGWEEDDEAARRILER